jgi:hypothetical protein
MKQLALIFILSIGAALPARAQVKITQGPEQIAVEIDGKPFTVFYVGGRDLNRPYLHPLRSASGKAVTRSYPAGQVPGESVDHPHHAGVFYGHGDVNGFNYWAIQNVPTPPGKGSGTMGRIVVKDVSAKSGKESGSVDAVLTWLTPDGKPLLTETRKMTFHSHPDLRIVDFDFDFAAIDKVVFRDTKEGTFALRMAGALDELRSKDTRDPASRGKLTNAQGGVGEANVWGKRSAWVDYSGQLDGEKVGIVMMDHPGNPRHPTYWHSRGYGLHSINPFGVHDYLNDKNQDGSLTIQPGEHVRFRYRVVVHPGVSAARLAELYKQYSATGKSSPSDSR